MRAVILCGGKGTRLRPYTIVLPKPLMPISEYPILEIIVRQLAHHGFDRVTMAVNHHAKIIQAFFGNGDSWGIKIDYSIESHPLSTMGPLHLIKDLPDNFLVMNGDILTDLNFQDFMAYHTNNTNNFTVAAFERVLKSEYGVLRVNEFDALCGFEEKPEFRFDVSMGIYAINRSILQYIPVNQPYGFDNLMFDLLADATSVSIMKYSGYWLDIGRHEDYQQAIDEFDAMKGRFLK